MLASQLVFESSDAMRLSEWWSKHRVRLLGQVIGNNDDMLAALKRGKKMMFNAKIELLTVSITQ